MKNPIEIAKFDIEKTPFVEIIVPNKNNKFVSVDIVERAEKETKKMVERK